MVIARRKCKHILYRSQRAGRPGGDDLGGRFIVGRILLVVRRSRPLFPAWLYRLHPCSRPAGIYLLRPLRRARQRPLSGLGFGFLLETKFPIFRGALENVRSRVYLNAPFFNDHSSITGDLNPGADLQCE